MFRLVKKSVPRVKNVFNIAVNRLKHSGTLVEINEEVRLALERGKPVVALESTIVTHGMPFPDNIKCAQEVELLVRKQGAIPATIALIAGKIKVGLTEKELNFLGDTAISKPVKTSRRDLAYVVGSNLNGGTTVSGTLIVANKVGIPIFATGGIGGVHRGANESFDISADLMELGKSGVAVVSSGVKSILDIPKTLEYLETQGVLVATFGINDGNNDFPAFYSTSSGCKAPYTFQTAFKAAQIIHTNRELNIQSGMLFAVPVPAPYAIDADLINDAISVALNEAAARKVTGKEITPFLLAQVAKITAGKSLETNIALIKNNAKTAADIAVELAKINGHSDSTRTTNGPAGCVAINRPVVIGGSNLDCIAKIEEAEIKLDGRIHFGNFSYTAGGVARNICEALHKLGCTPNFISAVGNDEQGKLLKSLIPEDCRKFVRILSGKNTAQCVIVLDRQGDCPFLIGDMDVHSGITPEMLKENENIISNAPLMILDGNLRINTLEAALKLADKHQVPVFYEPTDLLISSKPFETDYWKAVHFITPNLNELRHIAKYLKIEQPLNFKSSLDEAAFLARFVANYVKNVIVTLGEDGLIIARRSSASDTLLQNTSEIIQVRHYPVPYKIINFVNVSGAGDCLASGLISGILHKLSEQCSVSLGLAAARAALQSESAVPSALFDSKSNSFGKAAYSTLK